MFNVEGIFWDGLVFYFKGEGGGEKGGRKIFLFI